MVQSELNEFDPSYRVRFSMQRYVKVTNGGLMVMFQNYGLKPVTHYVED